MKKLSVNKKITKVSTLKQSKMNKITPDFERQSHIVYNRCWNSFKPKEFENNSQAIREEIPLKTDERYHLLELISFHV